MTNDFRIDKDKPFMLDEAYWSPVLHSELLVTATKDDDLCVTVIKR